MRSEYDFIVCGAGPIGLLASYWLGRLGFSVLVLEEKTSIEPWSKAIGLMPPSLDILSHLGLDGLFVAKGLPIQDVQVHGPGGLQDMLGSTNFGSIGGPWPFILSIPQSSSEAILENSIAHLETVTILRGAKVTKLFPTMDAVVVSWEGGSARGTYLLGCDGANSTIRSLSAIPWVGHRYGATFVMGDFNDTTGLGSVAHLFFTKEGAVESFPLPGQRRRWIVQTKVYNKDPSPDFLVQTITQRTGITLNPHDSTGLSPFGTQRFLAKTWVRGRIILLGDAAHTMSPIGGQGMNTGFADVAELVPILTAMVRQPHSSGSQALRLWEQQRKRSSNKAAQRAEVSMTLGTITGAFSGLRNLAFLFLLGGPWRRRVPVHYAMLSIDRGPGLRDMDPRNAPREAVSTAISGTQGVYIHRIATVVPQHSLSQDQIKDFMLRVHGSSPEHQAFLEKIYAGSAIEKRHSVLADYGREPKDFTFFPPTEDLQPSPGTAARNHIFATEASSLAIQAVEKLLTMGVGVRAQDITHIISVSCTGFTAPGFEQEVQKRFSMGAKVQRYHIAFMGCYGAFPALRLAWTICKSNPQARVLIVDVELCTLHFQSNWEPDILVANALFADGGAAALVSARPEDSSTPWYTIKDFSTTLVPESGDRMAWEPGDTGYVMKLSSYVPKIIEKNLPSVLGDILSHNKITHDEIQNWAIHPGGRGILDRVQTSLGIPSHTLEPSYGILKNYGNMSSATIFFVLARTIRPGKTFAAAFGPGLTVETGLFERNGPQEPSLGRGSPLSMELRSQEHERMDLPQVSLSALKRTIEQFGILNRLFSGSRALIRQHLFSLMVDPHRTYHLVDIGAGGGDLARWMIRESRKRTIKLRISCLEPDTRIVPWLVEACKDYPEITVIPQSSLELPKLGPFEFAFSNHVLHHMSESSIVKLLKDLHEHCTINFLLNDLRRSFWAYLGYNIAVTFLAPLSLARFDGSLSIRRGFRVDEVLGTLSSHGLQDWVQLGMSEPARIWLSKKQP